MALAGSLESMRVTLAEYGQDHLLQFVDAGSTTPEQSEMLLTQVRQLDFGRLNQIFAQVKQLSHQSASIGADDFTPISDIASARTSPAADLEAWRQSGLEAIAAGKVAALVLSGGQGTRLGFDGSKGMYDIGLPSHKPIFQLFAERILRLSQLAGAKEHLPFYVMTSPLNHEVTKRYFADHNYFGLRPEHVMFFEQGTMPCFGLDGKILLETPYSVAVAPDGNGSVYQSMEAKGMLIDMERRGIEHLHIFSVDNVLGKVADPTFVGFCISIGADCGSKVVWKSHSGEKVGVMVNRNGKPGVLEYSEMSTVEKERVDTSGKLVFGAGNICSHYMTLSFIRDTVLRNLDKAYHAAKKKIACVTYPSTETVKPSTENGIKLEIFIFDPFQLCKKKALLEVAREDEFAAVKDAPGGTGDTPEKALSMLSEEAKRWVIAAGGRVVGQTDEPSEISPLVSYQGEGLEERVSGKEIALPIRFL